MNIFEQHGLMLLAAEQGRQQFNRDVAALLRTWWTHLAVKLRHARRRLSHAPVRH